MDFDGGYIGFTTGQLHNYVKTRSKKVILERDHGGPMQGKMIDDGVASLVCDSKCFDLIHIDPWRQHKHFASGLQKTEELIATCLSNGFSGLFEIGTEQSIREFSLEELRDLSNYLSDYPVKYLVIQSGTSLNENKNTGLYDARKLKAFTDLAFKFGWLSKEHNGDYLEPSLVRSKFSLGLNAINIAPEFGFYESSCYLEIIGPNTKLLDRFYEICYDSNQWKKWVSKEFDVRNKTKLIEVCGHYILESNDFIKNIKNHLPDISMAIKNRIKHKISEIS